MGRTKHCRLPRYSARSLIADVGHERNMTLPSDNETWLIDKGDEVIEKRVSLGEENLSLWDKLVYCLWVADYGMRNAGDLATAIDLHPSFQADGLNFAEELNLSKTSLLFHGSTDDMEKAYFSLFESVCDELKAKGC